MIEDSDINLVETRNRKQWRWVLTKNYLDYMEGRLSLDDFGEFKLSQLLQTCVYHDESYHKDCIYFNAVTASAFIVKGDTCNLHEDRSRDVPILHRKYLTINPIFNLLDLGAEAEPAAIAYGVGFPRREFQWFFCDQCVETTELIQDLRKSDWPKLIVEKYESIWVDMLDNPVHSLWPSR